MKIVCVGAGPAALYFAILMKRRNASHDILLYERNSAGRTHGWGVVYWDDLLQTLQENDPKSASGILDASVRWNKQTLSIRGRKTVRTGRGGYSIGRQRLLEILARRATDLGVEIRFDSEVNNLSELPTADLVAACDGAGSRLRQAYADRFKTNVVVGRNKYIWLGTTKVFDAFTFDMVETSAGWIWFHGYPFSSGLSTCVIECSPETWQGLGFDKVELKFTISRLNQIFEVGLDGHQLRYGESSWLNFRTVSNEKWFHERVVLMGDAAHTTHFSIGSGTKLAFEDAIVLANVLQENSNIELAFTAYEKRCKSALVEPTSDARFSALWFENLIDYVDLSDEQFFTLLYERRSPLLHRLPPRLYYRLHQIPLLSKLRQWIGPRARAAYSRRYSDQSFRK